MAPTLGPALFLYGLLRRDAGDLPGAQHLFERAVAVEPTDTGYRESLASVLAAQGEGATAIVHLKQAVASNGASLDLRLSLGRAQCAQSQLLDGAQSFLAAVTMAPECTVGWLELGSVLVQLGQYQNALSPCFEHASQDENLRPAALLGSSEALIGLHRLADAAELLAQLRSLAGPDAWLLAACWALATDSDQAELRSFYLEAMRRRESPWVEERRLGMLDSLRFSADCDTRAIFVGSIDGLGIDIIESVLATHPDTVVGPIDSVAGFLGRLPADAVHSRPLINAARAYIDTLYRRRWANKSVINTTHHNLVHTRLLSLIYPRARFVHVVAEGDAAAEAVRTRRSPQEFEPALAQWESMVLGVRLQGPFVLGRLLEVRYDDLCEFPERELLRVCDFLGLEVDVAVALDSLRTSANSLQILTQRAVGDGCSTSEVR